MIDFDKMTRQEHEAYKEMVTKARAYDKIIKDLKEFYDNCLEIDKIVSKYERTD